MGTSKNYQKYTPDFRTEIVPTILQRARYKCEGCGVKNHAIGCRDKDGNWYDDAAIGQMTAIQKAANFTTLRPKVFRVVLCVAHLDQNRLNNAPENLKVFCQQCHNRHDAPYRGKNAHASRRKNLGLE